MNECYIKSVVFYEWIYNIDVLECIVYFIFGWEEYIFLFKFFKKNSLKLFNIEGRVM